MTEQQWTVTQELQGALVILDEAKAELSIINAPDPPGEKIDKARTAIEKSIRIIQHARCDATTALDRF